MIFIIAGRHFRAIIGPGSRTAFTWFDTTVSEPFKVAAAGNGVYAARTVNYTVGAGPHFGVALDHNFAQPGLSFLTNLDIADTFTCIRQRFSTATTTLTPAGRPAKGEFQESFFWNEVPILNFTDPNGLQVLKCRVSVRRHFRHPSSFQGRGCENGRSTEDPASES